MGGEAEGFPQFIEAREQALLRTAWLLTGDWALAQDLVQRALARSWPYWGRIRRGDDPEIYVRRVMLNTWVTWRRRRWRAEEPSGVLADRPDPGDMAADVATRIAVRQVLALRSSLTSIVVFLMCSPLVDVRPVAMAGGMRACASHRGPAEWVRKPAAMAAAGRSGEQALRGGRHAGGSDPPCGARNGDSDDAARNSST